MKNIGTKIYYLMLSLSVLPLFFANEIYPYIFYVLLFIYFSIYFIYELKNRAYQDKNKIFITIDLIAVVSLLTPYKYLVLLRLIRIFKFISKIKSYRLITQILKENKDLFITVYSIVLVYMVLIALILFQVEPQTFNDNYFTALYWAGVSLTTVGYGDIYPITVIGKVIGVISSLIGIGIVALPTGVIASKFMSKHDVNKKKR